MMSSWRNPLLPTTTGLCLCLCLSLSFPASAEKRPEKKKGAAISVMDSSEAQWGRRSINDSIYRGYTVNGVYHERNRQRLPDSFNLYRPTPITTDSIVKSSQNKGQAPPATIDVNGQDQTLPIEN